MIHLLNQGCGIHDDSVADHAERPAVEDAGRHEMKNERPAIIDNGMPRVRPSLVADDRMGVAREDVDDFAFPFVAPLGPYDNQICHRCGSKKTALAGQNGQGRRVIVGSGLMFVKDARSPVNRSRMCAYLIRFLDWLRTAVLA